MQNQSNNNPYSILQNFQRIENQPVVSNAQCIDTPTEQPLLIEDQLMVYKEQEQNKLFQIQIITVWILQEFYQLLLCTLVLLSEKIDEMFYNYESESRRPIFYISLVIWVSVLAIIKFYRPSVDRKISVPLLCIFTMFYSVFVCCTLSGSHHKTESANVLYIFGFIWYIITGINLLNFVGLLICSALSQEVTFKNSLISMLIIPFLSFLGVLAMFGARSIDLLDAWIAISGAVTVGFGAYFIYIMQKTIAKIRENYFHSSLSIYANMFLPCII